MQDYDERHSGVLYVVGTPIGNLQDISPRARQVLASVAIIAAEDTRHTRGLLSSIGVKTKLMAYHEHNEPSRSEELIAHLQAGESVALVADAGMPLISDPGLLLVRRARELGIEVLTVPGPSAVSAALSISGLPSDRFVFEGFLPRRAGQRRERIRALAGETRTMIFFESVHRLGDMLGALREQFGGDRPAAIAREMTKLHEACYTGSLRSLQDRLGTEIPLRGEFVVLVAGAERRPEVDLAELRRVYELLLGELAPSRALALTAEITGMPRNAVYRLLRLKP